MDTVGTYDNVYAENHYGYTLPMSMHINPFTDRLYNNEWWQNLQKHVAQYLHNTFEEVCLEHGVRTAAIPSSMLQGNARSLSYMW